MEPKHALVKSPNLAMMAAPPEDPVERDRIGGQLWEGLVRRFEKTLSERDLALWRNPPQDVSNSPDHLRIVHLFDDFILGQFAEWNWRLMMSYGALQRLAQWEIHSPQLLRRLGEEMERKSKVFRGEKSARLPDDIDIHADYAIEELGRLLRMQRDEFAQRSFVSCERIAEWMKAEVEARVSEFPKLNADLSQLHAFVESLPRRNPDAARRLEQGDFRPEGFFYQWYGAFSNRSPKDVENQIAHLRAQR